MQVTLVSILLAALANQAYAVLFITNPTASTSAQGGQSLTITWQDNGTAPSLSDMGPCEIGLYAGNMQQQTELQAIAPSVDVGKQNSQDFNIDSNLGPNYNGYFIRITSLALKDPNNPQFPYEAFSSKFTLTGMSGTFNPSVQAQISGVTSASIAAATPTVASSSASAPKMSTTALSGTVLPASASVSSSAPKSTQSSAAGTTRGNIGVLSAISVVVGLVGLTL